MTTTRAQVRQKTQAIHDTLDEGWISGGGFASEDAYRSFLLKALKAHVELGLAAAKLRTDGSENAECLRIEALHEDLGVGEAETSDTRHMSYAFSWGVGYALNGSALGASTILKSGGLKPSWPRRYLTMGRDYARNGGVRAFFDQLDNASLERSDVVAGALAVFEVFNPRPGKGTPQQTSDSD